MKKLLFYLMLILLSGVLSNCGSSSKVTNEEKKPAVSKLIAVPEGKSLVYFVRPSFLGTAINFKVFCDDEYVGLTKGSNYIYTIVEPGKHTFLSQAENKEVLQMVTESGKVYFIEQIPQMGAIKARNKLVVLNEEEGNEKLNKCKLNKEFQPK
ncbi:MAG: DUF2846 domain-containing protein [Bacteroidales bacterium]|nr:DUF2846 domain-containing protein [Bacteroidales bacterium]